MGTPLGICDCGSGKNVRWHIWYKGFSSPMLPPFPPANIAYNTVCDDCAARQILEGQSGWPIVCIKLVDDQFLADDDRAFVLPDYQNSRVAEKVLRNVPT